MDCPICNSQNIEIGTSVMEGKDFSATIHYAACHALLDDDPNWGGGYDCEFFIVRESEEVLLADLKRLTMRAADGVGALPENEDWLNESMCSNCCHSKSRHQTAGGFCKHCTCNEFVESATQPRR